MARFNLNRRLMLVLALAMTLVASPALVGPAHSIQSRATGNDPLDPGAPPGASGDPDMPTGPAKSFGAWANGNQVMVVKGVRTEGDGRAPQSVLMLRLRVVLQALRVIYLRF